MADYGLTKAIKAGVRQGRRGAKVLRPAETELLAAEKAKAGVPTIADPAMAPVGVDSPNMTPLTKQLDNSLPGAEPATPPEAPVPEIDPVAKSISEAKFENFDTKPKFMPNFDQIKTTGDIKAVLAERSVANAAEIKQSGRGVITHEALTNLANDLDVNSDVIQKVMTRESGGVLNPETILSARQVLHSSAARLKTLADKMNTGQATDMEKVQFARQLQFHNEYHSQFTGARTETARSLNAFGIPVGADDKVAGRIAEILANSGTDFDRVARAIGQTTDVAGITKIARGSLLRRTWDSGLGFVNRVFVNGILSGPSTHIANVTGNAMFQAMNTMELAVAARLGRFLPGAEHVQAGEALASLHGSLSAIPDAFRLGWRALRTGDTLDGALKYEATGPVSSASDTYLGRIGKGVNSFIGLPTRSLGAEDDFFKTIAYRASVERQMMLHVQDQLRSGKIKVEDAATAARDFLENTPKEAQKAAEDWARDMTFQTPLGPTGARINSALRSVPILTLIAPFIRTPVNIFKQAVYRSPMAVFSSKFRADVGAGGAARDLALTRFAIGSGLSAWVAKEVAGDNITGGGPQQGEARMLWMANGRQPYSIRIKNPVTGNYSWHSYARLEPLASVIGATADTTEILSYLNSDPDKLTDEEHHAYDAAGAIIAGIMNNTGNKTFMKGISDFMEFYTDPKRFVQSYTNQMGASLMPYSAAARFVRNTQDPYLREAWTLTDKIKDNIPGYSKDLPMRLDLFGEPREKNSGSMLGTMSPIPESPEKYDSVVTELTKIMSDTGRVPVTMPDKRVASGMRLNAREYADLVRFARKEPIFDGTSTFHDKLEDTILSDSYQDATPTMKFEMLRRIQSAADEIGRVRLEEENSSYSERLALWKLQEERLKFGN